MSSSGTSKPHLRTVAGQFDPGPDGQELPAAEGIGPHRREIGPAAAGTHTHDVMAVTRSVRIGDFRGSDAGTPDLGEQLGLHVVGDHLAVIGRPTTINVFSLFSVRQGQ